MVIKEGNVKLTLSVDEELLREYKKYCGEIGLVISKQVENFMKKTLEKRK